jgi:hypothetical protein
MEYFQENNEQFQFIQLESQPQEEQVNNANETTNLKQHIHTTINEAYNTENNDKQIKIAHLNVNTITHFKLEKLMNLFNKTNIDIFKLIYTRITMKETTSYKAMMKRLLKPGDYYKLFDIKQNSNTVGSKEVGGMMIIMSSRIGPLINSYEEGENLGVYTEVQHLLGCQVTTNATTYWPYVTSKKENGTRGLRTNINNFTKSKQILQDPIEFTKYACTKGLRKAERNNNVYILTGDLNQQWNMKKKTNRIHRNLKLGNSKRSTQHQT